MSKLELKVEVNPVLVEINVLMEAKTNGKNMNDLQKIHLTNITWDEFNRLLELAKNS